MTVEEEWEKLPRWCSLGMAADFLEVGVPVARRLAEDGALDPSFRTAGERGHWRISKDGIAACIGLRVEGSERPEERPAR